MKYTNKEKVIELLYKFHVDKACEDCVDAIECLPSEDVVERSDKTGHWVWEVDETPSTPVSPYELNYAGWVCSCCHEFPNDICEWDNPNEPPTYKYCPNCGAKMK